MKNTTYIVKKRITLTYEVEDEIVTFDDEVAKSKAEDLTDISEVKGLQPVKMEVEAISAYPIDWQD